MKVIASNPKHRDLKVSIDDVTPNFIIEADDQEGYVICAVAKFTKYGHALPTEKRITYRGKVEILAPLMVPIAEHPSAYLWSDDVLPERLRDNE